MRQPQAKAFRPTEAAQFLGIGTSTLWRWAKELPDFPKPTKISSRVTIFDSGELAAWRAEQARKYSGV